MRTIPPKVYKPALPEKPWQPISSDALGINTPFHIERFIYDKVVNKNESWDVFIAGDRGVGKSASAMSLAMMIDPAFTVDHWAFTAKRYAELMTSGLKKGSVVVFDDMGTSAGGSSRKWQAKGVHELADLAQLGRTDGIITIGTSLQLSRTELRLRAGFKVICQPISKLSAHQTGFGYAIDAEFRYRVVDAFADTVRYKLFRSASGNRVKYIRLHHPPQLVWDEYQAMRQAFLDTIKAAQAVADNARNDVTPPTDKEWAAYLHVSPMKYGSLKNLVAYVAANPDITKPALIKECGNILGVGTSVVEKRIKALVDDNVLVKRSLTGSRAAVDQVYDIGDVGNMIVEGGPIP